MLDLLERTFFANRENASDEEDEDSLLWIEPESAFDTKRVSLHFVLNVLASKKGQFGVVAPLQPIKSKGCQTIVARLTSGMNRKLNPEPTPEGLSGSYFLKDRFRNRVAIFKPRLEEPFAPLNPKGVSGPLGSEVHVSGIFSGSLYLREVAAFIVDSEQLFSVPETFLTQVDHPFFLHNAKPSLLTPPSLGLDSNQMFTRGDSNRHHLKSTSARVGSIQKMVVNNGSVSNISVSKLPVFEVQKIALLDLLIMNADRNEGNILFFRKKGEIKLLPIDHGLSFGTCLRIRESEVVWSNFPQIDQPLDPRLVDFVENLCPRELARKVKASVGLEQKSLDMLRIMGIFVKVCVARGLSLKEMSALYYRRHNEEIEDKKSKLEKIIDGVEFMCEHTGQNEEWYKRHRILKKAHRASKRFLDDVIKSLDGGSQHTSTSEVFPSISSKSQFEKNKLSNEKLKLPKKSQFKKSRPFLLEDQHTNSFIFSSRKDSTELPVFSNEDLSRLSLSTSNGNLNDLDQGPLKLETLESIQLSEDVEEKDFFCVSKRELSCSGNVGVEAIDGVIGDSGIKGCLERKADDFCESTQLNLNRNTTNKNINDINNDINDNRDTNDKNDNNNDNNNNDIINKNNNNNNKNNNNINNNKEESLKLKHVVSNASVSTQMTDHTMLSSRKSMLTRTLPYKTKKRSLSAFASKQADYTRTLQTDFDFVQERAKMIGTSRELGDLLRPKKKKKVCGAELRFHYFECCLEQYLEGWMAKRFIHRARRKYTLKM